MKGNDVNVCINMLAEDADDSISECEAKSEEAHIADFLKNRELTRDWNNMEEKLELQSK